MTRIVTPTTLEIWLIPMDTPRDETAKEKRSFRLPILLLLLVLMLGIGFAVSHRGPRAAAPLSEVTLESSGVTVSDVKTELTSTDWPAWRGPSGDGHSADQTLPTKWDTSLSVKWRCDVPGRGHSSPIVVGDSVLLATALESEQEQWVLAYNRAAGTEMWRTKVHQGNFPSKYDMHAKSSYANGTLASDGQRFYTAMLNDAQIDVTALDPNGKIVWQQSAGGFVSKFGYAASPLLYKSLVIIAADHGGGGYLAALDAKTGELAWRTGRGDSNSYSSPTVASYDPATGTELWTTPCLADATCGTIVVSGDRICASGGFPQSETVCLSPEGEILWSNDDKLYEPSLIVHDAFLYGVTDDGIANAWSMDNGSRVWRKRLGGNFSSSPVLSNGLIYVANLDGECFVIEAEGKSSEVIQTNRMGDDMYASPAISDNEIFIRVGIGSGTDRREELVCIADSAGQGPSKR